MYKARDILRGFSWAIVGYFIGFHAAHSNPDPISSFKNLLMFIVSAIVIGIIIWFDRTSQQWQSANWEKIRTKGKWSFVLLRYLVATSFVLLALLFLPFMISLGPTSPLLVALVIAAVVLCPLFVYIGLQEWSKNEREFLADPILKAAHSRIVGTSFIDPFLSHHSRTGRTLNFRQTDARGLKSVNRRSSAGHCGLPQAFGGMPVRGDVFAISVVEALGSTVSGQVGPFEAS